VACGLALILDLIPAVRPSWIPRRSAATWSAGLVGPADRPARHRELPGAWPPDMVVGSGIRSRPAWFGPPPRRTGTTLRPPRRPACCFIPSW